MWKAAANNEWNIEEVNEVSESIECLITKKAENQIKALCAKYNNLEWLAGLHGYETKEGITITHLQLFEQEISGAYVELTNKGSEEMSKTKTIGWIHSHNTMRVFFSSTDTKTSNSHQVSIVVNNKFEVVGKTIINTPYNTKLFVPLKLMIEKKEEQEDPIIKEAEIFIKERSTKATENKSEIITTLTEKYMHPNVTFDVGDVLPEYVKENKLICFCCDGIIGKRKLLVDEGIPYHQKCWETLTDIKSEEEDTLKEEFDVYDENRWKENYRDYQNWDNY